MPLRIRGACDQYPRAGWPPSDAHLVVVSAETVVGSISVQTIKTEAVGLEKGWRSSITCVSSTPEASPRTGAKQQRQLADAWRT
jgi:hypothetical protein